MVEEACIKQGNIVGVTEPELGTSLINQRPSITVNYSNDMQLIGFQQCFNSETAVLTSFTLTWQTSDGTPITTPGIGPESPSFVCGSGTLDKPWNDIQIIRGQLLYEEQNVQGFQLVHDSGEILTVGRTRKDAVDRALVQQNFKPDGRFIGFWGAQTETSIQALGFLTYNPGCQDVEPLPETTNKSSSSKHEVKVDLGLVFGYLGGFVVLIIISVAILCLAKNRQERANKVHVLNNLKDSKNSERVPVNP